MTHKNVINLRNDNLAELDSDFLSHLNICIPDTNDTTEIEQKFGDVKFVCMGGTRSRMLSLAQMLRSRLDPKNAETELLDLCEKTDRYSIFKVGPVLCCSHGVGMSSMSVMLHEVIKLVSYAKCNDPKFIRIGTSGGVGLKPGTVVVSKLAFNGYLRNEHEIAILGERVIRPARFNEDLLNDIVKNSGADMNFDVVVGNTMAADCFYEGQGRLDGASCGYTKEQKLKFLQRCYDHGIRNIEMEATMFASLTLHVGVKAADVCVALLNRLNGDQIDLTHAQKVDFEKRPMLVVSNYIESTLT